MFIALTRFLIIIIVIVIIIIIIIFISGVDMEFEKLLITLFGKKFIDQFKAERPVGWMDLMIAFESRKRSASPYKNTPLNISLPFAFIDYYKKIKVNIFFFPP